MTAAQKAGGVAKPMWVRWIDRTSIILAAPATFATFILMAHVIIDVIGRTFFNRPLPSTLEIAQYWWMVLIVFGALGYAMLRGEHVRATLVTDHLPQAARRGAEIVALLLLGIFAAGLAWYGWQAATKSMDIQEAVIAAFPVPVWPFKWLLPLGAIALALQCIASIYRVVVTGTPTSDSGLPAEEVA